MRLELKMQMMAVAAMAGIGVAAPVVAWTVRPSSHAWMHARGALVQPIAFESPAAPEPTAAVGVITLAEVTLTVPRAAAARDAPDKDMRCFWHESQAVATGRVWVCDNRDRTHNGASARLLEPTKRPSRMAPHDMPSPTGLFR